MKELPSVPGARGLNCETAGLQVMSADYLNCFYPRLAKHVSLFGQAADGTVVRLRLRIGEWPEFYWGPRSFPPMMRLVGPSTCCWMVNRFECAIIVQWTAHLSHPRFGRLSAKFNGWNPHEGELDLTCCRCAANA